MVVKRLQQLGCAIAPAIAIAACGTAALAAEANQAARQDFLALCADCHGEDARGNGPSAKNLTEKPPDLTRISDRADGRFDEKVVFDWIVGFEMPASHGTREMPIWGDWLLDEAVGESTSLEAAKAAETEVTERVMALVRYLRTLQQ
jgi:mono/diheme cytochrome c family protein